MNIVSFVKGLMPSLSKTEMESDVEISLQSTSVIIETWKGLEEISKVGKFSSSEAKKLVDEFYKEVRKTKPKVKLSATKNIGADMVTFFGNVKINGDYIYNEMSETLNDVIVSSALSAYKANILRSGGHLYFITRYALDFANYLFTVEMENSGADVNEDYLLNKKQKEFVEKNMWIYARIVSIYGDEHKDFVNKFEKLGDVIINKETAETVLNGYDSDKVDISSVIPDGFVGSPIYSVRQVFAQWEADRYKTIKDKKRLLELRYLHLKTMMEQGTSDVAIEKEINFLQKQITSMDYKLSKIERSVA